MDGISLCEATSQQIAEFFLYFHGELKLLVSVVRVCRAALNHVFLLVCVELAANRIISRMFRSFERLCPPLEIKPPYWNLSLVLRSLTHPPYEPMKLSSDKHLTWKMCFLALTSAERFSELHGLSFQIHHCQGWKFVTFSFLLDFAAKTQNSLIPDFSFNDFSIPSSDDFVGGGCDELPLSPIRVLKKYLARMEQYRPGISGLFVSTSQNTISFWLRSVINLSYVSASDKDCCDLQDKAQEVRKAADSLLFRSNCAVHHVLKAGTWSSQSTFSSSYHGHLDTFSIGPLVVAQ